MVNEKIIVHASIGAGGNHVRWLLLLDNKFKFLGCDTIEKKLNFVSAKVYPLDRTYSNWLTYEWQYRNKLNQLIFFRHPNFGKGWENKKEDFDALNIFVTSSNPQLPLRLYKKFNTKLNTTSDDFFIGQIENEYNESLLCVKNHHGGIVIDTVELYQKELSKELYNKLIKYCNLDDNYELCLDVHCRWFELHEKAQQEFGNIA